VKPYTVDTSALLVYLVDALPAGADHVFQRAEANEVSLELPTVAAVETLYRVKKGVTVRGTEVSGDPVEFADALETKLPVTVVEDDEELLKSIPALMEPFPSQMHDAMIVGSHQRRETEAIVTSDDKMAEEFPTIWE